jgi:hypothetical protein
MIRTFLIFSFLILWNSSIGQVISQKDSLEILRKAEIVFNLFENPDYTLFKEISTDRIYCILCFDLPFLGEEDPYILDRKEFFDYHLKKINTYDNFIRATKSTEIILLKENDHRTDITIYFTIYQKDELAPGHEGAQLGLYFKKVNGEFKFSGMDTIP